MITTRNLVLAAVLGLAVTGTQASAKQFTLSFDGVCDVATVATHPDMKNVWSYVESTSAGSCQNWIGVGTAGTTTLNGVDGRWLTIGIDSTDFPGEQDVIVLQYPLVTGGQFYFYDTTDGKHVALVFQGTYTVGAPATSKHDAPDFRHLTK